MSFMCLNNVNHLEECRKFHEWLRNNSSEFKFNMRGLRISERGFYKTNMIATPFENLLERLIKWFISWRCSLLLYAINFARCAINLYRSAHCSQSVDVIYIPRISTTTTRAAAVAERRHPARRECVCHLLRFSARPLQVCPHCPHCPLSGVILYDQLSIWRSLRLKINMAKAAISTDCYSYCYGYWYWYWVLVLGIGWVWYWYWYSYCCGSM